MKLNNFNRNNHFALIVNFHNRFVKALTEIFQFRRALVERAQNFISPIAELLLATALVVTYELFSSPSIWNGLQESTRKRKRLNVKTEVAKQDRKRFILSRFVRCF